MSIAVAVFLAAASAIAQDTPEAVFEAADARLAEARTANAELLSPANFERAMERYADAEEDLARGRPTDRIRTTLNEVIRLLDQAIGASEIAAVTLAAMVKTREDAENADAQTFASELWAEAEEQFDEAARQA